jgi:hypothetical protein
METSQELGKWTGDEFERAEKELQSLKTFRGWIANELTKPAEFFEPNHRLDPDSRKQRLRRLKFFNQTSFAHALLLRHEFALKLLSVVDGYILAFENKNYLLVYLSARHTLELVATVNALSSELHAARSIDIKDWEGRGRTFLSTLCRGRYSSSDPIIAELYKSIGVSKSATKPILISDAIKKLAERPQFKTVVKDYDFLSNICHHNGSSHQLFHRSIRQTDRIQLAGGSQIVQPKPATAVTLEYPPPLAYRASIAQTAHLVYVSSVWIETLLREMPMNPFDDSDFSDLTDGQVQNSLQRWHTEPPLQNTHLHIKVGRNDPCPCGSGKKFKRCCMRAQ